MQIRLGNAGAPRAKMIDTQKAPVEIPNLWHIAQAEPDPRCRAAILECWHMAHDLRDALYALANKQPNHQPEWLSQALNEGDGSYRP